MKGYRKLTLKKNFEKRTRNFISNSLDKNKITSILKKNYF